MKTRSIRLCHVSVIMVAAGLFQAQKPMAAQTLESLWDELPLIALPSAQATPPNVSEARRQQVAASYAKLPMSFEANRGQSDRGVKFLARGNGYSLFLTSNEAVLALKRASQESEEAKGATDPGPALGGSTSTESVRMKLVDASPATRESGVDELPGKANYFIGNDAKKWRTNVPTYAKVKYEAVYPGVDLIYYGNQQQLEYDFVVAAGADPKAIRLSFRGAEKLSLDEEGNLVLEARHGQVRLERPQVYQEAKGERHAIEGHYLLQAGNTVSFRLASYDHRKPLVIDPTLAYSTYLGGSSNDVGLGIAVDRSGNAYVAGTTFSTNFPTVNALQPSSGGGEDAFAAKINASGSALVYSTYLGGSFEDFGYGIAVDRSGNAYVTGYTQSTNFPTVNALQPGFGGVQDAFAAKINASGSALMYSTYLGGSGNDSSNGIAVDSSGNAYVTGLTLSTNFPTANALQPSSGGSYDAFVAKINASGSALVYSTYLGGSGDEFGRGIVVDSSGNAYVTGFTGSTNFPTANALQPSSGGGNDAFAAKINASGSALRYSTYLGGSSDDEGFRIAVDSSGNAYVTGQTTSTNFPTANALQLSSGGGVDAFAAKINASGSALMYSTYLGGSGDDIAYSIAVDSSGNAYVTGRTLSTNFPTVNALQPSSGGGNDAFAAKINASGSALVYSTYLGGSGGDIGYGIAVDSSGNAYVTGRTVSTNFPTANALQPSSGGGRDAFLAKIVAAADLQLTNSAPPTVNSGSTLTYTIVVNNLGPDLAVKLKITDAVPTGATFNSVTFPAGTCTTPPAGGTGTVTCSSASLASTSSVTETLVVNVIASSGATIFDDAHVTSTTFDPTKPDNSATVKTKVN